MLKNSVTATYRRELMRLLKMDAEIVSAEGDWLVDAGGRRIYDGVSQYGANILGHNHPEIVAAATRYLSDSKPNFIQPFGAESAEALADGIMRDNGLGLVHHCFTNSGAETVEAAIKLARLATRRTKVVSLKQGFHGKTYAALSASGSNRHRRPGIYDKENFAAIAPGDLDGLEALLAGGDVAAFLFEPVQGEGGMSPVDDGFLRDATALCRDAGALVIADEIQCGLGRCGALILSDARGYGVDVVCIGKGLSGGLAPIGLVLYTRRAYSRAFDKKHSSTFAGGGFAANVAGRVVDVLTRDGAITRNVADLTARIDERLARLSEISGGAIVSSGAGLMRAVDFTRTHSGQNYFCTFIYNSGLMAYVLCSYLLNTHDVLAMPLLSRKCAIRFEPALNTTTARVDGFFDAMEDVAGLLVRGRFDILIAHLIEKDVDKLPPAAIAFPDSTATEAPSVATLPVDREPFDFAFFSHTTSKSDFIRTLPRAILDNFTPDDCLRLTERLMEASRVEPSPDVSFAFEVEGRHGKRRGVILSSLLEPASMMRLSPDDKLDLIDEFAERAEELGARVAGLGAYTSVITRGGADIENRYKNLFLTTGNTLTAASTVSQVESAMARLGKGETVLFGARGSVGRLIALMLAQRLDRMIFVGKAAATTSRYRPFLENFIQALADHPGAREIGSIADQVWRARDDDFGGLVDALCADDIASARPIIVTDQRDAALAVADYVVSCTSEGKPFLNGDRLKATAIAFDAARPFDFKNAGAEGGPTIIEAGLLRQPVAARYGDNNLLVEETGSALGCFSETMVLALEGASRNYSIGKEIPLSEYEEIVRMSERHGFSLPTDVPVASTRSLRLAAAG